TTASCGAAADSTRFQLRPASVVLYRPRSPPGVHRSPVAATPAVPGSVGCTTTRAIARLCARPTCVQVAPASVERYTPLPQAELLRSFASPVPTHTTFGSDGATATAPMEATGCFSNTASNVAPFVLVFTRPPVASPTKNVKGSCGSNATSDTRPPMSAGPMLRASSDFSWTGVSFATGVGVGRGGGLAGGPSRPGG